MVQTKARMLRLDEVTYQRLKFLAGDGSMGGLVRSWTAAATKDAPVPSEAFASSPLAVIANALVSIDEKLNDMNGLIEKMKTERICWRNYERD